MTPDPIKLEAYLDGQLTAGERAEFERAAAGDPTIAEQIRLQKSIDASLGRLFAESRAPVVPAIAMDRAAGGRRLWVRPIYWSIAAVLAFAVVLGVYLAVGRGGAGAGGVGGATVLATAYHDQVAGGFVPKEVCTTSEEFVRWTRQYVGQPIYPAGAHPGVEFVGWTYAPAISASTPLLLAKVDGKEVIVAMDRKVREKSKLPLPSGDLHAFRAEVGSAVLYEVTPLDHPGILPILSATPPGK